MDSGRPKIGRRLRRKSRFFSRRRIRFSFAPFHRYGIVPHRSGGRMETLLRRFLILRRRLCGFLRVVGVGCGEGRGS